MLLLRDELGELAEQAVERRREHGAAQHVRDVRPRALAKADEHAILARTYFTPSRARRR